MLYTLNAYTLSECMEIMADKIAEFERDNQKISSFARIG